MKNTRYFSWTRFIFRSIVVFFVSPLVVFSGFALGLKRASKKKSQVVPEVKDVTLTLAKAALLFALGGHSLLPD